jgi:hypothetical protein
MTQESRFEAVAAKRSGFKPEVVGWHVEIPLRKLLWLQKTEKDRQTDKAAVWVSRKPDRTGQERSRDSKRQKGAARTETDDTICLA